MYGRNAIMNIIITKARTKVEGHYQLSGSLQKVKDDVEWLLKDAAFMYGDIKLQVLLLQYFTIYPLIER